MTTLRELAEIELGPRTMLTFEGDKIFAGNGAMGGIFFRGEDKLDNLFEYRLQREVYCFTTGKGMVGIARALGIKEMG